MEIKRDAYLRKLINKRNNCLIKIVTGIRRCGKSYLLNTLFKNYLLEEGVKSDHIISIALDDINNISLLDSIKLNDYIRSLLVDDNMYYIILDEIQLVDNFVAVLNGLLRLKNVDIYVTGSNSKFLSSDIVTEFRGRGDEIRVYPLSFKEFFSVSDKDKSAAWKDYVMYGGLPLVILQKNDSEKIDYLNNQQKKVYLNDVIERNKVENDKELLELTEVISSSVGSLTNPSKLYNVFVNKKDSTITDKTIYNYLNYLEDAFIIEKALRYDVKGKKYINTPYKYYFTDIGIRNSFLEFRQIEENHIMENIIYTELKRRGCSVDVGVVEIREKGSRKRIEIDFVVNKGYEKYYIQSALNIDSEDKKNQELRPLLNVDDFFKKIIIVNSVIPRYKNENGILIMGIYDFLLNEDSLDY